MLIGAMGCQGGPMLWYMIPTMGSGNAPEGATNSRADCCLACRAVSVGDLVMARRRYSSSSACAERRCSSEPSERLDSWLICAADGRASDSRTIIGRQATLVMTIHAHCGACA